MLNESIAWKKMCKENVSVCMASYNGALYIKEQIASILPQLSREDELIIIDDRSTDNTKEIISAIPDNRIKLYQNTSNKGVVKSFEEAVRLAGNEYIFLADQDDIWTKNRMEKMLHVIQRYSVMLVTGNMVAIDKRGNRSKKTFDRLQAKDSCNYMLNISRIFGGKASYFGCAMAFKRELKEVILPFPKYMESHDTWIAMAANLLKSNVHLEYTVLEHRLHGNNVTKSHRKLGKRLHSRILFARALGELSIRIIRYRIIQGGE